MTIQSETGSFGEKVAKSHLQALGYKIEEANFHSRFGEIDIIAWDKDTLAFVEVKNYKKASLANPYQAIGKSKQEKIIKTAKTYLMQKKLNDTPCRFDVIILTSGQLLEHLKGAFFIR